jgi:excinuclease UvrABC helicase subunit UvrB
MSRLFEKFDREMDSLFQNEPLFDLAEWMRNKKTVPSFTREFDTVVNNIATKITVHFDKYGYPIGSEFSSEKYQSEEEKLMKKLDNELQQAIKEKVFLKAHNLHLEIENLKKKLHSSK